MQYDFDQVVDRSKNLSAKYDERVKKFGTDDVIPLWIADMDFRTAQPVIDALKARAEEGIWGYTARPASYFEAVKNWQKRRNGWDIRHGPHELQSRRGPDPQRHDPALYPPERQCSDPDPRVRRVL